MRQVDRTHMFNKAGDMMNIDQIILDIESNTGILGIDRNTTIRSAIEASTMPANRNVTAIMKIRPVAK